MTARYTYLIPFLSVSFSTVLHENELTHTDLKPENILFVNSDFDIEITRKVESHSLA